MKQASRGRRIVIVGGGSNAWTPNIVKDMLLTPEIADSTFVATDERRRAFEGGDYFIITICYLTNRATMRRLRLVRTSIDERKLAFRERDRPLLTMVKGEIPEEFTRRSRETAADIIAAHATGRPFIDVGNLPRGVVVETAVRVDGNGFSPICFGDLPQPVLGMVEPHAHVQATVVRACLERDRDLAFAALRLDPLCAHLAGDRVREMGERLLRAHRKFTEGLFA